MELEGSTEHKKSYASTLHGDGESKVDRQEPKKKQLTLSGQELVQISDSQAVALVKVDFGPIPFKLFHSWLQRDGFDDCIKKAYNERSFINPDMSFHEKLKCLEHNIKEWNRKSISIIAYRKHEVLRKLTDIKDKIDSNTALDIDKEDRVKLLKERDGIQQLEDMDLIQKLGLNRTVSDSSIELSPVIPPCTLSQNDNLELEKPVSDEEIRLDVWDCGSQKAPGPDGFSFLFLKTYWELLKEDVVKVVRNVFDSFVMPIGANSSFITLIPKIPNPIYIKDFRPISLVGLQYKIIAKILANRLSKVIDKVVSNEQSAFISGRYILDGPLMHSEIMSWYKKKKINMLLFKVDFEKSFDSVSWKFLNHMLLSLGFGNKWRSWIQICLHFVRSSILINGSPSREFLIKRGLRQGHPLSPFLFIIIMEGLLIALKMRFLRVLFKGQMSNIIHVLNVFYLASSLKINVSKSNVYGLGVDQQDIKAMARDTSCGSEMSNIIHVLNVFYLASSLKINVSKSNVYGLGVDQQDIKAMARDTSCGL
nr:putative RNA-directed DNA polymerase, eukaryota, reverse transcriptase zinc-binding domain protein [Tanacetum cinerariifolium]